MLMYPTTFARLVDQVWNEHWDEILRVDTDMDGDEAWELDMEERLNPTWTVLSGPMAATPLPLPALNMDCKSFALRVGTGVRTNLVRAGWGGTRPGGPRKANETSSRRKIRLCSYATASDTRLIYRLRERMREF